MEEREACLQFVNLFIEQIHSFLYLTAIYLCCQHVQSSQKLSSESTHNCENRNGLRQSIPTTVSTWQMENRRGIMDSNDNSNGMGIQLSG